MASNGVQLAKLWGLLSPREPQKYMQAVKTTGLFNNNFHLQNAILGHASQFIFKNVVKLWKGSQIFAASQSEQDLLISSSEIFSYFFLSQLSEGYKNLLYIHKYFIMYIHVSGLWVSLISRFTSNYSSYELILK